MTLIQLASRASGVKIFKSKSLANKVKSLQSLFLLMMTLIQLASRASHSFHQVTYLSSERPPGVLLRARLRPQPRHCISSPPLQSTSEKQERLPQGLLCAESPC